MSGDEDGEWVVVRARSWVAIVLDEDGMGEGKGREVSLLCPWYDCGRRSIDIIRWWGRSKNAVIARKAGIGARRRKLPYIYRSSRPYSFSGEQKLPYPSCSRIV